MSFAPDGQVIVRDKNGDEFEFVLKNSEQTGLMMAGLTCPPIFPKEGQTIEVWGVVTVCVKWFSV